MSSLDMLRDGGSIIIRINGRPFCIEFSCDSKTRGSVYEGETPGGDLIDAGSDLFSLVVDEVQSLIAYHERNAIYAACRPNLVAFIKSATSISPEVGPTPAKSQIPDN